MGKKRGRHVARSEWTTVLEMYLFAIEHNLPTIPPDLHGTMVIIGDYAPLFLVTLALAKHPFVQRGIEELFIDLASTGVPIEVRPASEEGPTDEGSRAHFIRATITQSEPNFVIKMQLDVDVADDEDWVYLQDQVIAIYKRAKKDPLYAKIKGLGARHSAPGWMEHWFGDKGADGLYVQLVKACESPLHGESLAAQLRDLVFRLTDIPDFPFPRRQESPPPPAKAAYYAMQCSRAALHFMAIKEDDSKVAAHMANMFPDMNKNLPEVTPEDIIEMQQRAAAKGHFITCGALVLRLTVLACMWVGTVVEDCVDSMTDEIRSAVQKVACENDVQKKTTGYELSPKEVPKMIRVQWNRNHLK